MVMMNYPTDDKSIDYLAKYLSDEFLTNVDDRKMDVENWTEIEVDGNKMVFIDPVMFRKVIQNSKVTVLSNFSITLEYDNIVIGINKDGMIVNEVIVKEISGINLDKVSARLIDNLNVIQEITDNYLFKKLLVIYFTYEKMKELELIPTHNIYDIAAQILFDKRTAEDAGEKSTIKEILLKCVYGGELFTTFEDLYNYLDKAKDAIYS